MDNKTASFLKRLQLSPQPDNYVRDNYDIHDMNTDVSNFSEALSPEDIEKIHYAESTGGKYLKNQKKGSTASGHYQVTNDTKELAKRKALENNLKLDDNNPYRNNANEMKALVSKYQDVLFNSENGPYEPTLKNIYALHHYGPQGGLDMLNNPESPIAIQRFKNIENLLNRKPINDPKLEHPAKNLLDLLRKD